MHSAWWRERLHVENRAAAIAAETSSGQDVWLRSQPIDVTAANTNRGAYPSGSQTTRLPANRLPAMDYDTHTNVWPAFTSGYSQTLLPSRGMLHEARYHPRTNQYLQGRTTLGDQQYISYASHPLTASCTGGTPHSSSVASNNFHLTWTPAEKRDWLFEDPTHLLTTRAAIFTTYDQQQQDKKHITETGGRTHRLPVSPITLKKDDKYDEESKTKKRYSAGRKLCNITAIKEEHLRRKVYV